MRIPRHHFPLGVVAGSLALVLYAGVPLQRVARVLSLTWSWWAEGGRAGTYYSVRLWLIDKINHFKRRVALTPLACLLPPALRGKARYMNIDVLVEWAEKSLTLLAHPEVSVELGLDTAAVEEKLGWLRQFTEPVRCWREILQVIEATEHYVRHEGIHRTIADQLATPLPIPRSGRAQRLRQRLLDFLQGEAGQVAGEERLLGSSEVLESIIGSFKNLAGEHGRHGLTGMVLGIGALVGNISVETAEIALGTITNRKLREWCQSHLGSTLQSLRRRIAHALSPEQKQEMLLLTHS